MVKHSKPKSFYDTYERKGEGTNTTHYCPGCGHGTAHKLIAELIDEFGIQDRTIFVSPVGCSVFAFYYFDTGNVQAAHGRAPAVGTGIRRSLKDAIVISYQGDGDLAGIGMGAIVHAANRGENMTVFFINNAIYGMTGGQMAPTTLLGQKTLTTPLGRTTMRDGNPIGMCELLDALKTPVFIERVTLTDAKGVLKARKAFKKGLLNQIEKRGFSFIEVLSPCPVNWKMPPTDARRWVKESLEPEFPVKNFRDLVDNPVQDISYPVLGEKAMLKALDIVVEPEKPYRPAVKEFSTQLVKISGFGGQGVMSAGVLLADCAIMDGLHATWLPSYGPEMRGGTANASVIVSDKPIGSPVVIYPSVLFAMNGPSMSAFEKFMKPGGLVLINGSIVSEQVTRKDLKSFHIPASDLAREAGLLAAANVVMLTVYVMLSGVVKIETLKQVVPMSIKHKHLTEVNIKAIDAAAGYVRREKLSL
ncbi:MAG: 2-ketoisovalerate ferredoxin oxidoreductase [Spirochaetales bacterium]|nr:MAG: 2-ketoisovalerate ferredoxin oxidoreductase [Spirochaetales bacterium]